MMAPLYLFFDQSAKKKFLKYRCVSGNSLIYFIKSTGISPMLTDVEPGINRKFLCTIYDLV